MRYQTNYVVSYLFDILDLFGLRIPCIVVMCVMIEIVLCPSNDHNILILLYLFCIFIIVELWLYGGHSTIQWNLMLI